MEQPIWICFLKKGQKVTLSVALDKIPAPLFPPNDADFTGIDITRYAVMHASYNRRLAVRKANDLQVKYPNTVVLYGHDKVPGCVAGILLPTGFKPHRVSFF